MNSNKHLPTKEDVVYSAPCVINVSLERWQNAMCLTIEHRGHPINGRSKDLAMAHDEIHGSYREDNIVLEQDEEGRSTSYSQT